MHLIVPVLFFSLRFISTHGFWINGRGTISELYAPKEGGGSAVYVEKGGDFCERLWGWRLKKRESEHVLFALNTRVSWQILGSEVTITAICIPNNNYFRAGAKISDGSQSQLSRMLTN